MFYSSFIFYFLRIDFIFFGKIRILPVLHLVPVLIGITNLNALNILIKYIAPDRRKIYRLQKYEPKLNIYLMKIKF